MYRTIVIFLVVVLVMLSGCGKTKPVAHGENSITVSVEELGVPVSGAYVYVSELFPLEVPGLDKVMITDSSGKVKIDELYDDMYQVWVSKPGYGEAKQRVPLFGKRSVDLKFKISGKTLPEKFKDIYAYGTFNGWSFEKAVKLKKDKKGVWRGEFRKFKGDSSLYAVFFDEQYLKYYNLDAEALKYMRNSQPAFLSVAFPRGKDSVLSFSFDENKFKRDSRPFLNQWTDREMTGVANAGDYIKLEKIIAGYYQQLTRAFYYVSVNYVPHGMKKKKSFQTVLKKLKEYYVEDNIPDLIDKLETFTASKDSLMADLARIELAKVYKLFWMDGKATETMLKIDENGFAGGETVRDMRNRFQGGTSVLSGYVARRLKKVTGRKARYELWNTKVSADSYSEGKDAVKEDFKNIIEEFPDTELAEQGRRYLEEN